MSELLCDHFSNAEPVAPSAFGLTRGTLISTAFGPRLIETLKLSDQIETLDSGLQPLRSIHVQKLRVTTENAPIRIEAGVIGNDAPLLLGPHHHVLITGWQAELFFGQEDVLIEAGSLVNGTTITRDQAEAIEYFSLGFDEHQIILAHDAPVESDLPHQVGSFYQAMLPRGARDQGLPLARSAIAGFEAEVLAF